MTFQSFGFWVLLFLSVTTAVSPCSRGFPLGIEGELPYRGVYTVTVPGAVAGWAALHQRFGRLPLATDLAPAIWYAEHGFPVMEVTAELWARSVPMLSEDPESRSTFLTGGRSPRAGET